MHAAESRVFWIGLIVFPLVWAILFILAIFRFSFRWLVLDCIALSLNGANLYGYLRCKLGKGTNLTGAVSNYANGFFRQQVMDKVHQILVIHWITQTKFSFFSRRLTCWPDKRKHQTSILQPILFKRIMSRTLSQPLIFQISVNSFKYKSYSLEINTFFVV